MDELNTNNPVLVLNDGETFTSLDGCMVAFADNEMGTDEVEQALLEDSLDTFTFGQDNGWTLSDTAKVLKLILVGKNIQLDTENQTITIQ